MTVLEKIIRMQRLSEYEKEKKAGSRIVVLQVFTALMATVIAFYYSGSMKVAIASFWGAMTAALNGVSLVYALSKIEKIQIYQPQSLLRDIYRNSMERYVLVVISLSLGMGVFKLPAKAVLLGFVVAQVVPIVARIILKKR